MDDPPLVPRATYRIQFRNGFGFADAAAIVPYLADLGISHLYASPIFKARSESSHGYDAVDFNSIDPTLGGEAGFDELSAALKSRGMGLLLDFVPNHMGIGPENAWWQDVLANSRNSAFADYFDIDWAAGGGKVVLPFLGSTQDEILAADEFELAVDADSGSPVLRYYDHQWPIAPGSIEGLLRQTDVGEQAARETINSNRSLLAALLDRQAYRLIHWRDGPVRLNYRRFFEIDDLVALRMDREEVFEASHSLLLRLIAERKVQGVRLDHIDGLLDPLGYCRRLMQESASALGMPPPSVAEVRAGQPIYLLVEKILGHGEEIPDDLMAAGTTGYEFMTSLAGLMVDPKAEASFAETMAKFGGEQRPFAAIAVESKIEVLTSSFAGELDRLANALLALAKRDPVSAGCTLEVCRNALTAVITAFPVYRTYVNAQGASAEDRRWIEQALAEARLAGPFETLLRSLLCGAVPSGSTIAPEDALDFAMRFQQLTGPVMAKAVEDRAFYRDVRLLSLNDVGGEPDVFGGSIEGFHYWVQDHQAHQPAGMLATATHDHKRGEDARARLHVLSEMPEAWQQTALRWRAVHAGSIETVNGGPAPREDDEYLIYQTLVGIWPPGLDPSDQTGMDALGERLIAYVQKASREAAVRTRWTAVDQAYEAATESFIRSLMDTKTEGTFLRDVHKLVGELAGPGMVNSLTQTALKLTLPGVPDFYQGTEHWDFSLVDPDNRHPVDFNKRAEGLASAGSIRNVISARSDGRIKHTLMAKLLRHRQSDSALFAMGDYQPVAVTGACADHVFAFARCFEQRVLLVAVPRLISRQIVQDDQARIVVHWGDTRLSLPAPMRSLDWTNVLADDGTSFDAEAEIRMADIAQPWPLAVLCAHR